MVSIIIVLGDVLLLDYELERERKAFYLWFLRDIFHLCYDIYKGIFDFLLFCFVLKTVFLK